MPVDPRQPITVRCGVCIAPPGRVCNLGVAGERVGGFHKDRVESARVYDLTESQVTDLVSYFLGADYYAREIHNGDMYIKRRGYQRPEFGPAWSWLELLTEAKVLPLPNPEFAAIGCNVMRGIESICMARSATFARRISNALNLYQPNSRGQ